jgi:hypothetical protein
MMDGNFKRCDSVLNIALVRDNPQLARNTFKIAGKLAPASLYHLFAFHQAVEQFQFNNFCPSGGCYAVKESRETRSHQMSGWKAFP